MLVKRLKIKSTLYLQIIINNGHKIEEEAQDQASIRPIFSGGAARGCLHGARATETVDSKHSITKCSFLFSLKEAVRFLPSTFPMETSTNQTQPVCSPCAKAQTEDWFSEQILTRWQRASSRMYLVPLNPFLHL